MFDSGSYFPAVFLILITWGSYFPPKRGQKVGEHNMELIENNVSNNTDDIRQLKQDVDKVEQDIAKIESTVKLMQQSQTYVMENVSELKTSIKALGDKWDAKWEQEKKEEQERYEQDRRDQRNRWWGLVFLIIGTIVLTQLGLK